MFGVFFVLFFFSSACMKMKASKRWEERRKGKKKEKETKPWEIKSKSGRILFQGSHYTVWRSNKKKKGVESCVKDQMKRVELNLLAKPSTLEEPGSLIMDSVSSLRI